MRKIITLAAVFLLVAGFGAAAEDPKTENGEDVNIVKEKKLAGGGKTVGAGQVTEILELSGNGDEEQERGITIATYAIKNGGIDPETVDDINAGVEGERTEKRSARKGRNPQTGKEIKIPAADVEDPDGTIEPYVWVIETADKEAQEGLTIAFDEMIRTEG